MGETGKFQQQLMDRSSTLMHLLIHVPLPHNEEEEEEIHQ